MIKFKEGLYDLNPNENFNFQLNRLINWDGGDLEEVRSISREIKTIPDWSDKLIQIGDIALKDGRTDNAIAYYRMSEFFMNADDPRKLEYYKIARKLFYDYYKVYFDSGKVKRYDVKYEDASMPVMHVSAEGIKKDTIVLHGGNDSYMEELFFSMLYMAENGYEVYLFEGPGQGKVLREYDIKFTNEWEKPVKAIIDYFDLDDITLIGVSLGGMLAPRAAAFENRIKRVVCWALFPSFESLGMNDIPKVGQFLFKGIMNLNMKSIINWMGKKLMKKEPKMEWVINQGMYAYGGDSTFEYIKNIQKFTMLDIADKINQDILIIHGKDDHLIDWKLYRLQIEALENAKSVTFRLFTKEENASDHCQCGNTKLALDTVLNWIDTIKKR
ncbi:MAG: alpha/beta fold hydrolase [Tissierellia bacterium]|nr:alpha/beta fold hydrolase [Tissierellia bacterium]